MGTIYKNKFLKDYKANIIILDLKMIKSGISKLEKRPKTFNIIWLRL